MLPRPRLRRLPGGIFLFSSLFDAAYLFVLDDSSGRVSFRVATHTLCHIVACTTAREQKYYCREQSNYRDDHFCPCWFRCCPVQNFL